MSNDLQSIIKWMMEPNPYRRPTVDDLLESPIINDLYNKRMKSMKLKQMVS